MRQKLKRLEGETSVDNRLETNYLNDYIKIIFLILFYYIQSRDNEGENI